MKYLTAGAGAAPASPTVPAAATAAVGERKQSLSWLKELDGMEAGLPARGNGKEKETEKKGGSGEGVLIDFEGTDGLTEVVVVPITPL